MTCGLKRESEEEREWERKTKWREKGGVSTQKKEKDKFSLKWMGIWSFWVRLLFGSLDVLRRLSSKWQSGKSCREWWDAELEPISQHCRWVSKQTVVFRRSPSQNRFSNDLLYIFSGLNKNQDFCKVGPKEKSQRGPSKHNLKRPRLLPESKSL